MEIGIIGLPNVGKSTLFNALLKKQVALAANYPFATIEPNVGVVDVPDERLAHLAEAVRSEFGARIGDRAVPEKIVPATVRFVDIAGLVEGAHKGEGLGNQFLAHIRDVDALVHIIRAFDDDSIVREGSVDPETDRKVIETELLLADIQSLEKRIPKLQRDARGANDKVSFKKLALCEKLMRTLNDGHPAINVAASLTNEERGFLKEFQLLTAKPVMHVYNVSEEQVTVFEPKSELGTSSTPYVVLCASVESEICSFGQEEAAQYLESLGIHASGLDKVIKKGYELLDLITFFTAGPKEVHAWTVRNGAIHTDFEKGFICAEVVSCRDLISCGSWQKAKTKGLLRTEGKTYLVCDGDVIEFRFNV